MRNANAPGAVVARLIREAGISHAELSRRTGIRYADVLREVKHQTRPLSFYNAAIIADAIGVDLTVLIREKEVAA